MTFNEIPASYIEDFVSEVESNQLYQKLLSIPEIQNQSISFPDGSTVDAGHGKVMFVDKSIIHSTIFEPPVWGKIMHFPTHLLHIREKIERLTQCIFPVCVGLYYPNGQYGMAYHSDLPAFGDTSIIGSVSLGAERRFLIRENGTGKELELLLKNGSLLIMQPGFQNSFEHALPEDLQCVKGRINLTFRKFGF